MLRVICPLMQFSLNLASTIVSETCITVQRLPLKHASLYVCLEACITVHWLSLKPCLHVHIHPFTYSCSRAHSDTSLIQPLCGWLLQAQKSMDHSPTVRRALYTAVGAWLVELKDRYSFWHKLLTLMLNGTVACDTGSHCGQRIATQHFLEPTCTT